MTKLLKSDLDKLIFDGIEYEIQELRDIITQLEAEKQDQNPDAADIIIFHGKEYPVMRATYKTIKKVKRTLVFKRYAKTIYEKLLNELQGATKKQKSIPFYFHIPFLPKIIESIDGYRIKKEWNKLAKLTFGDNAKDFTLNELTETEVTRIMRIFFRFQPELSLETQDVFKKNSQDI